MLAPMLRDGVWWPNGIRCLSWLAPPPRLRDSVSLAEGDVETESARPTELVYESPMGSVTAVPVGSGSWLSTKRWAGANRSPAAFASPALPRRLDTPAALPR